MAFNMERKLDGTKLGLFLRGSIDEDAQFPVVDLGAATEVLIDLDGVNAINSVGIREWVKWVKQFPSSLRLSVHKCPKIVVDQINMVAGFLPPGTVVESFYVPYFAEGSGAEKMILFNRGKEFGDSGVNPPAEIKDEEGEVMEMDVIEAKYFKFLNG
jgi:hypothetical protein